MKTSRFSIVLTAVPLLINFSTVKAFAEGQPVVTTKFTYPIAPKGTASDDFHGTKVEDPYRWLEDVNSNATQDWITAENKITQQYIAQIPERDRIHQRLTDLWNYERYAVPIRLGRYLFYSKNNGLQNQSVLYVQEDEGMPKILIDPNLLSSDGTTSLSSYDITRDGSLIAYGLSRGGSDWQDWYVRDVKNGKELVDHLKWVKNSSAAWLSDNSGFYYCRYEEPAGGAELQAVNYFQKLYFHKLGEPQTNDKLVFERKDEKELFFSPTVTDDGRYLVVSTYHGTSSKNGVLIQDLKQQNSRLAVVFSENRAMYHYVGNVKNRFYFLTDDGAPRGRLVAVNLDSTSEPDSVRLDAIVKESEHTLENASLLHDSRLVCSYLKDAASQVQVYDLNGLLVHTLALPGIGTASGFSGLQSDRTTYFAYTGYTDPGTIFELNLEDFSTKVFFKPKVKFDNSDYVTEQIFYASKDGTKIPMAVSYKRGIKLDGNNPTYLYGYGGFKISLLPLFSVASLAWMERGGVYAVPALRGGGEYGEDWHVAGMKHSKQNVFDDFIAAAQALCDRKYTCPEKLAIGGGSNGGLLVGACMTQRPDMFAAALPSVGVMDMLRFDKYTIGWAWTQEYGSASNAEDFPFLFKYSPLHNLKKGTCYPATMISTADRDDRVVPAHSFKFAAALQAAQSCNKPVLIRVDTKAGHGMGKSTAKIIDEVADKWAFLSKELKMTP